MPKVAQSLYLPLSLLLFLTACQPANEPDGAEVASDLPMTASIPANETPEQRAARLQATFPAQQRAPQDPAKVAQGSDIYEVNCRTCHGRDLRGGEMGGPNLLRSDLVLQDQEGELIGEVVRQGRTNPGMPVMPALPLADAEVQAVAAYIHSITATARGQGAPPPGTEVPLDIVVGSADKGAELFGQLCSSCHSVTGDLAGLATRIADPENLQNSWVAGRHWNQPVNPDNPRRMVTVTVTLDTGERVIGKLGRRDDFTVSLTTEAGAYRSFSLTSGSPRVTNIDINDPLARHLELLSELNDDMMHNITAYLVTLK